MSPIRGNLRTPRSTKRGQASFGREHLVFPRPAVVPLRADRDLERAHVRRHVDAGEIEGERSDAAVAPRLGRRREVAMPGLGHRPLEGRVEADLDDLVLGPEHGRAHRRHPRMRAEVDEAAERLRMDFHIPAARPPADCAARPLDRLPERGHHVLAHPLNPVARESALQRDDPIAIKDLAVGAGVNRGRVGVGIVHRFSGFLSGRFLSQRSLSTRKKFPIREKLAVSSPALHGRGRR